MILKKEQTSDTIEYEKRLPDNEPVSASNADTAAIRIKNKKKMKKRNEVEL